MIITKRLLIRNLTLNDRVDLFDVVSNKNVMAYIQTPFTLSETENFIKDFGLCSPPKVYAAQLRGGKVIGHVIYHPYSNPKCYELGWIIGKAYCGKGFAKEIMQAMINHAISCGVTSIVIECNKKQKANQHIAFLYGFHDCDTVENLEIYKLDL